MTQHFGPWDSGTGESINNSGWRDLFFWLDGVLDNNLAVSAGSGMQVNIATGKAALTGLWYYNDASLPLTIAAADSSNPRLDLVVIQANISAQSIAAVVKTGTPASSPVAPTVEQDSSFWEIALAQVLVPANASSSASFTITDKRVHSAPWTPANQGSGSGLDADTLRGHAPGSGNGLDADTLDGHDSSYFLAASVAITIASAGGGSAGKKIWVGTTDPGGAAGEGDIWLDA